MEYNDFFARTRRMCLELNSNESKTKLRFIFPSLLLLWLRLLNVCWQSLVYVLFSLTEMSLISCHTILLTPLLIITIIKCIFICKCFHIPIQSAANTLLFRFSRSRFNSFISTCLYLTFDSIIIIIKIIFDISKYKTRFLRSCARLIFFSLISLCALPTDPTVALSLT